MGGGGRTLWHGFPIQCKVKGTMNLISPDDESGFFTFE